MQEWWVSLDLFMKSLWCIGIFTGLVFIVQTVMTFVGMDHNTDFGSDIPDDTSSGDQPFQLFTFRNFINFFLGFSWTAISLRPVISGTFLLMVISVLVGVLLVAAVMGIFKWMSGMEQSGNINVKNAAGCKGSVYLTIPANREGEGKVQISIQGAVREYNAVTDGGRLPNGTPVRVIEAVSDDVLLVEKI